MAYILDQLAFGFLLTSVTGRLLDSNVVGKSELEKQTPLRLYAGTIQTSDPCCAGRLDQALKLAELGGRSLVTLSAENESLLSIAVLPLRATGIKVPGAALILSRASVCDPLMLSFFARSRRFTSSEEQVLALLSQGRSAPQIATELEVAVSTVRTQIQSVCAKAGSNGIRGLLAQLATLPPVTTVSTGRPLR
jgi:DNA-binding CsgD family transcriptional regulator